VGSDRAVNNLEVSECLLFNTLWFPCVLAFKTWVCVCARVCVGKWQFPFFLLHMGDCLFMVAGAVFHSSCPDQLACTEFSLSSALSMAPSEWLGFVG